MSLSPVEHFLTPVPDHDDLFAFIAGGKALVDESVTVEANGDLIIEGYAAVWEGDDRENENFMPGAFERATKAFIEQGGPLCFHHKKDHVLGAVQELNEDSKGLKMKARVDGEIATHPVLGTIYSQIKKGTLKGLSVGGFFKRALIEGKQKIADMDFTEISVTGVPVHTGPSFAVVSGKALMDDVSQKLPVVPDALDGEEIRDEDARTLTYIFEELDSLFSRIEKGVSERKNPPADNVAPTDHTTIVNA